MTDVARLRALERQLARERRLLQSRLADLDDQIADAYHRGLVDGRADALEQPAPGVATDVAADWLRSKLASGPLAASDVLADAEAAGIARRTLRRAKKRLGVRSVQTADGWRWEQVARLSRASG